MSLLRLGLRKIARTLLLLALVALATTLLMRFAPGYFSDAREMDAEYAGAARAQLQAERTRQGSIATFTQVTLGGLLHGNLGISRQYDIPVLELIRPRLAVTVPLLARGVACAWGLAFCAALPVSGMRRRATGWLGAPFTLLLAVPTGAMATLCLLLGHGGPVLVLVLLLAARDFKFLRHVLREAWTAPHLQEARARGLRPHQIMRAHILPNVWPRMLALAGLSLVTALGAIVPIEVVFDVPGLGQLAWTAAMNRDLPVLMAITLLMATAVAVAGMLSSSARTVETA
jgi:peptide/nickel transport system permease protein